MSSETLEQEAVETFPYELRRQGSKWCVGKVGAGIVNGGCHPTRAQAIRQMRALYAKEGLSMPDAKVQSMSSNAGGENVTIVHGPDVVITSSTSFAAACPKCGSPMAATQKECLACGHKVAAAEEGNEFLADLVDQIAGATGDAEERGPAWQGVLGIEGVPTADQRLLIPNEISERDLPIPLNVQLQTAPGHEDSFNAGRIDSIEYIPMSKVDPQIVSDFGLEDVPEDAIVIWGTGTFDTSEYADEGQRMIANGAGISLDLSRDRIAFYDPKTLKEVDQKTMSPEDALFGDYLQGIAGKIGGATIVTMAAFEQASIQVIGDRVLVASAYGLSFKRPFALTASAGPVKPPRAWFENPRFKELTPWTVTKEGRVYGHLADWDGCHIGFQGVCVPPFRSTTDYAYFNLQEIETAEGDLVPIGKIMFSRSGAGHAPTDPGWGYMEAQRYYDDATKVGAFVRAGTDRFGTWVAGALRSDLTDLEVQHMRTHGPSGDWRPIRPTDVTSELIAALAVPIQGFAIKRRALVASADGNISAIITAPLQLTAEDGARGRRRKRIMLTQRLREALGVKERTRAELRRQALEQAQDDAFNAEGPWLDDFAISSADRKRYAKSGAAMPDGSFPITKCTGGPGEPSADNAIHAQGRAGGSQSAVVAHIKKRVRALGCSGSIFEPYR